MRKFPLLFFLAASAFPALALHPLAVGPIQIGIAGPEEIPKLETEFRPRFDLLGAVAELKLDGMPVVSASGLSDEFGLLEEPPGFTEAGIGECFLKLGVGVLRKDVGGKYDFFHPYPVVRFLETETRPSPQGIAFFQSIDDFQGYGYRYGKEYRYDPASAELTIRYELANTGRRPIATSQYNHNFFHLKPGLDDRNYTIRTGFAAEPLQRDGAWCRYENRLFSEFRTIPAGCSLVSRALIPAAENRFELAHPDFPYAIRIGGDFESRKFAVSFKENEFISPEIFVEIHLKPGETRRWSRTYRFRRPPTPEPGRTRGGTSSAATRTHGGTAR